MTYHKVDPLRVLTDEERKVLTQISRSASEPASHIARAKAIVGHARWKVRTTPKLRMPPGGMR